MLTDSGYKGLSGRILVDIDNERPYDRNILGLSKSDEVIDFNGNKVVLENGNYIYAYTESLEGSDTSYILSEGRVIKNPYEDLPYKWCCVLQGEIEYIEDYKSRFGRD